MKNIPVGSDVIFIIGEIDCREGILLATERDMYTSIQEGINTSTSIFMDVLSSLISKKKIKPFIHPVMPVLKETRQMVMAYNEIYQSKVHATKGLKWLDFLHGLINDSGNLLPELMLDGTHVSPKYLSLLERAFQSSL